MKTLKLFFTVASLLLSTTQISLFAQSSGTLDYLVLNTGDTLYGKVGHIDETGVSDKFYKKIRQENANGKREKYKREDVASFRVDNNTYEGFWLNNSSKRAIFINPRFEIDSQKGERHFLKLISKDIISHYQLEWLEQGESLLMSMDLLKKESDRFFIRATQGLFGLKKKVLINYFQDCPALQEQIKKNRFKDVWEVVDYYNDNCIF